MALGLGLREIEVTYGESQLSVGMGEIPPGDRRPRVEEHKLVILLPPIDRVVEYELDLRSEVVDDIELEFV